MSILKKNFKDRVEPEVAEKLVQDTYFDAIEEKKINVIVHPEIQETAFADDGSFTYVAMVEVKPEFELQQYKGLEIEKPNCDVTDAEVEKRSWNFSAARQFFVQQRTIMQSLWMIS